MDYCICKAVHFFVIRSTYLDDDCTSVCFVLGIIGNYELPWVSQFVARVTAQVM